MKYPPLSVDSLFQEVVPNMVTLVGGLSLPLHVNRHGQPIHITGVLVLDGQAVFFRLERDTSGCVWPRVRNRGACRTLGECEGGKEVPGPQRQHSLV